ncbi:MAG: hypothetical protein KBS86_03060 [Proteobacteria bacterium]|nr:hypothetical protein [Candidatus Enterousia scatequi]
MSKRLFLFAGYDKNAIIDDALVYYIRALSGLGDVIFVGDSDFADQELDKIKPYTIYQAGKRHMEYDFGSYKRAYLYADKNNLLQNYDYIYMVNDSVYGPLLDLKQTIEKLESFHTDVFGIVKSKHRIYAPIESWFIGMRTSVAQTKWFYNFIIGVQKQNSKENVTIAYENGFTDLLLKHNVSWRCLITVHGRDTYNRAKKLFQKGCPFIKKSAFTRHNGALGRQIGYILNRTNARDVILYSANRVYGKKHIDWLLTNNPVKIFYRNITYAFNKLTNGKI